MRETLQKIEPTDWVTMADTGRQSAGNSDLQWLGGFMDGEGSFCFARHKFRPQSRGVTYMPCASIVNTHKPTIEHVVWILKSFDVGHWITRSNHQSRIHKSTYCVDIRGLKKMVTFLPLIIPHLFTKRLQAETLLEFVTLRRGGTTHRRYSDHELELIERVQRANRPGPSETTRAPEAFAWASSEDIVQPYAKA